MNRDELRRFLARAKTTRFIDYLNPAGETAEEAFERRLRWASMSRKDPANAEESRFLIDNEAALRMQIKEELAEEAAGDWVETTDPGKGWNTQRPRAVQGEVTRLDDEPATAPKAPRRAVAESPTERKAPKRTTAPDPGQRVALTRIEDLTPVGAPPRGPTPANAPRRTNSPRPTQPRMRQGTPTGPRLPPRRTDASPDQEIAPLDPVPSQAPSPPGGGPSAVGQPEPRLARPTLPRVQEPKAYVNTDTGNARSQSVVHEAEIDHPGQRPPPGRGSPAPAPKGPDILGDLRKQARTEGSRRFAAAARENTRPLLVVVLLLLIGGGGVGVWWLYFRDRGEPLASEDTEATEPPKRRVLSGIDTEVVIEPDVVEDTEYTDTDLTDTEVEEPATVDAAGPTTPAPPIRRPPVTRPPVTKPPVTKPPVTKPPETDPDTDPPETKPPETKPPETKPPEKPVTAILGVWKGTCGERTCVLSIRAGEGDEVTATADIKYASDWAKEELSGRYNASLKVIRLTSDRGAEFRGTLSGATISGYARMYTGATKGAWSATR